MNKLLKREKWDNKRKQKKNDENEREYGKKLKKPTLHNSVKKHIIALLALDEVEC